MSVPIVKSSSRKIHISFNDVKHYLKMTIGVAGAAIALYLAVARYHPSSTQFDRKLTEDEKLFLQQVRDGDSAFVIATRNAELFEDVMKKLQELLATVRMIEELERSQSEQPVQEIIKANIQSMKLKLVTVKSDLDLVKYYDTKSLYEQIAAVESFADEQERKTA